MAQIMTTLGMPLHIASTSRTSLQSRIAPGNVALAPRYIPATRRASLIPRAMDPASVIDASATTQAVYDVALNSATAGALAGVLKPVFSISSLLMIIRIVMTWYPEVDGKEMPWTIAYTPTEPILAATRKIVKPFNGLDVSPIVWVAILSFLSEILTGPQGILLLIERKGI